MGQRRPVRGVTTMLGVVPLGVGSAVLVGWYLHIPVLVRMSGALPVMQAATAVAFLFAGLAVLAVDRGHAGAAAILAAVVTIIGGLAVAARLSGLPLDAPTLLIAPPPADGFFPPRPMAPKSGLGFLLTGCALLLLTRPRSRSAVPAILALVAALAILVFAGEDLLKYGAEWTGLSGRTLKQMALHTAIAFLVLAGAIAAVVHHRLRDVHVPGARRAAVSAVVVLVLSALAAHGIRGGQAAGLRRMGELTADEMATRLAGVVDARREAVAALAAHVGSAAADSAEWTAFATALSDHASGIGRIAWVDGAGRERWSAPPSSGGALEPAIAVPVLGDRRPGGTVVAAIELPELLQSVVSATEAFSFELIVGDFRFSYLADDGVADPVFTVRRAVDLPGLARGSLIVRPSRALITESRRPLPLATLALGCVLAAMLAVIVQLGASAHARAAHLQNALARLEAAVRERRRAEGALARSEAQLRESRKMAAVARLAGGVAHHFNNLLSIVRGYADLVLEQPADALERREYLQEIARAADRGGELTRDLLTISARHMLQPRTLELRTVVYGQARALGRMLGDGIQLRIRAETSDTRVHIDPGPFTSGLATLAANARAAMPEGGSLALTLRERALTPAEASAQGVRAGAFVELEVADTGSGMDDTRREMLFEPFAGGQRPGPGGFGLAMLYGFVRQSGGAVEVESQPGRGSAFRLLLPRADARSATDTVPHTARAVEGAPVVLLAEDEDAVRRLAVRVLERAGFDVIGAADGEDALALAGGTRGIDVVVTDIVMPALDGAALARQLWEARPDLPVLFVSGYAAEDLPTSAAARTGFLQKPFEPRALVSCVRTLLAAEAIADSA